MITTQAVTMPHFWGYIERRPKARKVAKHIEIESVENPSITFRVYSDHMEVKGGRGNPHGAIEDAINHAIQTGSSLKHPDYVTNRIAKEGLFIFHEFRGNV